MSNVVKIIMGAFVLIGIYLVLFRGRETIGIIRAIAENAIAGVVALQGR